MNTKTYKFINKLRQMVDSNQGIRWSIHGDMLEIFDEELLHQAILKNFRSSKSSTFHRQLTYYQFYTFMHQNGYRVYKNQYFLRDNIQLEDNIMRNFKSSTNNQTQELINLQAENKKLMKQLKEIEKTQVQIMKNLQIQTKIHHLLTKNLQNTSKYLHNKQQVDGSRISVRFFIRIIKGLKHDSVEKITKHIFGEKESTCYSPIPFQYI
ncbi:hypothetical protein pb186bvf_009318 [Paramecium bursaria]